MFGLFAKHAQLHDPETLLTTLRQKKNKQTNKQTKKKTVQFYILDNEEDRLTVSRRFFNR